MESARGKVREAPGLQEATALIEKLRHYNGFHLHATFFLERRRPACQDKANRAAKMAALPGRTHMKTAVSD
jgi:hypothetical protein